MSTDFFEQQNVARQRTQWLRLAFAVAVLLMTVVVTGIVLYGAGRLIHRNTHEILAMYGRAPDLVFKAAGLVLSVVIVVAAFTAWTLRAGGSAVAKTVGGIQVTSDTVSLPLRQLLNVVEEMALAAHAPVPQVFFLPNEQGINAFAAGRNPESAAIGVTAGAVAKLDRNELQAVIGHEFSHILNGDMALNTRLIAWQCGLYAFTDIARVLIDRDKKTGIPDLRVFMIWPLVLGLYIAGSFGMLVGRILQAAISRRREQLADASAVQFTRNPEALKSALLKIAAVQGGANMRGVAAAGMAHLFFASTDIGWVSKLNLSWLATHPTLADRVQALDRNVDQREFRNLVARQEKKTGERNGEVRAAEILSALVPAAPTPPGPLAQDLLYNRLPRPQQTAIDTLLDVASRSADCAQATLVAALISCHRQRRGALMTRLSPVLGASGTRDVMDMIPRFEALDPVARLPGVLAILALVESQREIQRPQLLKITAAFAKLATPDESFGFALTRILSHRLKPAATKARDVGKLTSCGEELGLLLTLLARECVAPDQAFKAGVQTLLPPAHRPQYLSSNIHEARIDTALAVVAGLHPTAKHAFCESMARVIASDRRLTAAKTNLLRMICIVMNWQVPGLPLTTVYEVTDGSEGRPQRAVRS